MNHSFQILYNSWQTHTHTFPLPQIHITSLQTHTCTLTFQIHTRAHTHTTYIQPTPQTHTHCKKRHTYIYAHINIHKNYTHTFIYMNIHKHTGNSIGRNKLWQKNETSWANMACFDTDLRYGRKWLWRRGRLSCLPSWSLVSLLGYIHFSLSQRFHFTRRTSIIFLVLICWFYFMCGGVLPSRIHVHHERDKCARCPWEEKGIIVPGTGVKNESRHVGAGNLNQVTNDPTLQSQDIQTLVT